MAAQRYGKLRVRLSACMWVGMAAAFAFELRRILGRTVRIFRRNRAKKPKISAKTVFSAGIGRDWGGIAPWWASSGAGRWKIMDAIVVLRAGAHGRSHYYNVSPICVTLHSDEGGARFFWRESGKIRNNCAVGGEGLAEQWERKGARAAAVLRASERGSSAARLPHCHAGGFDANGRIC